MAASGITGIILAGGQSRRMGQPKALMPWGDGTLIEQVVETLRPLVDELIVAVNPHTNTIGVGVKDAPCFRSLNVRVVEDLVPDAHALGGLYTGLKFASHERCFVCSCDAPFLNPDLIRFLVEQVDGYDLVVPKTRQGLQPLHAIYATSALPAIEEQLRQRQWALSELVGRLRARVVEAEELRRVDPTGLSFFNLNTPDEYLRARRLWMREEAKTVWRGTGVRGGI